MKHALKGLGLVAAGSAINAVLHSALSTMAAPVLPEPVTQILSITVPIVLAWLVKSPLPPTTQDKASD